MELMFSVYGLAKLCFVISIGLFIWSYKKEPSRFKLVMIGLGILGLLFSPIKMKPVTTSVESNRVIEEHRSVIKDKIEAKPDLEVKRITAEDLK